MNSQEVDKFNQLAAEWWNPDGPTKMLHQMNPARVSFILSHLPHLSTTPTSSASATTSKSPRNLSGLSVLDVGCGGGLLSESLVRLGAERVLGLDAARESIEIARRHASLVGLLSHEVDDEDGSGRLEFRQGTIEEMVSDKNGGPADRFDIVCAMEILEHVDVEKQRPFIEHLTRLVKPGGLLVLSTMNKTLLAKLLTVELAENLMGWVPRGTHDWEKYIAPDDLKHWLTNVDADRNKMEVLDVKGLWYDLIRGKWDLVQNTSVNYVMVTRKTPEANEK